MPRQLLAPLALATALLVALFACTSDEPAETPAPPDVVTSAASIPSTNAPTSPTTPSASGTAPTTSTTSVTPVESTISTAPPSTVPEWVDDGDEETGEVAVEDETGMAMDVLPEGRIVDGIYVDPRGALFQEFQESFDRSERFSGLDAFCRPDSAGPEDEPAAIESGITESSIVVVQIDTRLDELAKVGFGVPVGDPGAMVATFVDIVNIACGGIHGRSLDLRTIEVSALGGGDLDIDTLREAACLEAVEIHEAVVVLATTPIPGTTAGCLTHLHRTSHIAVRGISDRDLLRGRGLLHSLEVGDRSGLGLAVRTAIDLGVLDDATIGVVVPDAPQRADDVVAAILGPLAETERAATSYQVGCEGTTTCRVGLDTAVAAMVADGVDVVIPLLDMTSLPWLVLEMLDQGMPRPLFIQSGLDGQGLDAAASRVAEFGGSPAGAYYDGTLVVDGSASGAQRLDGAERRPFDRMCVEAWAANTGSVVPMVEDPADDVHRTVVEACSLVRWIARAAQAAGSDPSRLAIQASLAGVGSLDVLDMRPTTVDDMRLRSVQVRRYEYPCRHGVGFGDSDGCLVPAGPPVVLDRSGLSVDDLEPDRLPPDQVRVFVANGSGESGVAGLVTTALRGGGYRVASPGNASRVAESTIYYRPGRLGDARAVQEFLFPSFLPVQMPPDTDFVTTSGTARALASDVIVVIGTDTGSSLRTRD